MRPNLKRRALPLHTVKSFFFFLTLRLFGLIPLAQKNHRLTFPGARQGLQKLVYLYGS